MDMTPERWTYTQQYCRDVFRHEDEHLASLMTRAVEAGLPDIAVSADVGRLLTILTSMTPGRRAVEVGTLAGYSAIWIARGLSNDGRLITIESEALHADFAEQAFRDANVADRVEVRRGAALDVLPQLKTELEPASADLVFLDAVKSEYPAYWELVRSMIAIGGLIIADNSLGAGDWWIDSEGHEQRDAADRFNRLVAGDSDFEAVAVPLREGVLIGRRMR